MPTRLSEAQVERLRTSRGMSPDEIGSLSEEALRRAVRRLDYHDNPHARQTFRVLQESGGTGRIPPGALLHALRTLDSMRAREAPSGRVAGVPAGRTALPESLVPPPTAGLTPMGGAWEALGPSNVGGRTRCIVPHPADPDVLWAGSVGGGVWRTGNRGASWEPVDDFMANLAVSCMAMDPTDPATLYAGTGEGFHNGDALRGAGIFRTRDGVNWAQLPSSAGTEFQHVNRLAISADGGTLLAATQHGIQRSTDADRLKWKRVLPGEIADVDFHPTDRKKAVAGSLTEGRAYYSRDGGETWSEASHAGPWGGRVEVTYARGNPEYVYASVDANGGEIWRSTDGGRSYTLRSAADGAGPHFLGDQGWYDNVIWAGDPADPELVIVGGVDLWRSTDGGVSLASISAWHVKESAHADHHCIVADPRFGSGGNRTVFFGNDGGIYMTDDVRAVGDDAKKSRLWTKLGNGYGVTQFFAGAANSAGTIIGGAQDNGTLRYTPANGASGWTSMFGGDGGDCAADPTDPNYLYGEYVYLDIHRSSNGGATAEYISGHYWDTTTARWAWKPIPYQIPDAALQRALFIAPFALDPNEPNRILAGGQSLWRTNDARAPNTKVKGPRWSEVKAPTGRAISAVAITPGNSDVVWVGHLNGEVYRTTNGTAASPAWQKIAQSGSDALAVTDRYCSDIVIDPAAPDTVYVLFTGFQTGNVWKSSNAGQSWKNIGNSLPAAPVRALAIHPKKPKYVYVGTEVGLFASEDAGATWSPTNEGPTNCSVEDLFWIGSSLVCVTHGRGMFRIKL